MRRWIALFCLTAASAAFATSTVARWVMEDGTTGVTTASTQVTGQSSAFLRDQACAAGTCDRTAIPSRSDEGMSLGRIDFWRVLLCAPASQTLSGGGSLLAWMYDPYVKVWGRSPEHDLAIPMSGVRCVWWSDRDGRANGSAAYRLVYEADGVTVSGGASLTVRIIGTQCGTTGC